MGTNHLDLSTGLAMEKGTPHTRRALPKVIGTEDPVACYVKRGHVE
jgi:hypothetical protein